MAGITATYISGTEFSVTGNRVTEFNIGRRIKADCGVDGDRYGTIEDSTSVGGITIVALDSNVSDTLTSNLTEVEYGIVKAGDEGSLPNHNHDGTGGYGDTLSTARQTVHVSKDGSDSFGDGSLTSPYLTINNALSQITDETATKRYLILVHPGVYTETPITMRPFIDLQSEGGLYVTSIIASLSTGPLITNTGQNYLKGFALFGSLGPRLEHAAVKLNVPGNVSGYLNDLAFANVKYGLEVVSGSLIADDLSMIPVAGTTVDDVVRVTATNGFTYVNKITVPPGTVCSNAIMNADGQGARLVGVTVVVGGTSTNKVVNAVNGSSVQCLGVNAVNSTYGVYMSGASSVDLAICDFADSVTNHIYIDDLDSEFLFQGGRINRERVYVPLGYTGDLLSGAADPSQGLVASTGDISVGRSGRGSVVILGEGKSYTQNMVVLTTDDSCSTVSDGTNFVDVSTIAAEDSTSSFTFQGVEAGHSILIGTTVVGDDDYKKFNELTYKISNAVTSATEKPFVVERWDGSEWFLTQQFVYDDTVSLHAYGNNPFIRADAEETLRTRPYWDDVVSKTINGTEAMWMRIRIASDLTTLPDFTHFRIGVSSTEFTEQGFHFFRGLSLYNSTIFHGTRFGERGGITTTNPPVGNIAGDPYTGWNHFNFYVLNSVGDGLQLQMPFPLGLCTSCPVKIKVNYLISESGVSPDGTMVISFLPVEVAGVPVADPSGTKEPIPRSKANTETTTSKDAQYSVVSLDLTTNNKILSFESDDFDVSNYYPQDMAFVQLYLDDIGNDTKNIVIHSIEVRGTMWSHGAPLDIHN